MDWPGLLLDTPLPCEEVAGVGVGPNDETEAGDIGLADVDIPLGEPGGSPLLREETPLVETPGLLYDGIPPGVDEGGLLGLVYWLGGDTGPEPLKSDWETIGTETEPLGLTTGGVALDEVPSYGGLTADDDPDGTFVGARELLVIEAVETTGDEPGLPLVGVYAPVELVDDPYTGG